jgi:MFS superfamily sulfate permease-like transporter
VPPQLSSTFTNAVIVTASLSRQLFPESEAIASERNLSISSGLANVLLCPFGAMPMCHGAGGLQAQYRFGGRTGLTPIIFGAVVLVLAVGFASHAAALFSIIPIAAVGALLIMAGTDLAISRRLFDGKPSCWWVIGVTALATLTVNPALGLVLGWITEFIRAAIRSAVDPERTWRIEGRMNQDDFAQLPLVQNSTVKEAFAEFCTGLNFVHGNLHLTFASVTADHSSPDAPSKRTISARIAMPIIGAIELRDLLNQLIDALTTEGVITLETRSRIVVPPRGRPH